MDANERNHKTMISQHGPKALITVGAKALTGVATTDQMKEIVARGGGQKVAAYAFSAAANIDDGPDSREAMRLSGICHAKGIGVQQDFRIAVRLFQRASELGDAAAHCYLGEIYRDGRGVERNEAMAYRHYYAAFLDGWNEAKQQLRQLEPRFAVAADTTLSLAFAHTPFKITVTLTDKISRPAQAEKISHGMSSGARRFSHHYAEFRRGVITSMEALMSLRPIPVARDQKGLVLLFHDESEITLELDSKTTDLRPSLARFESVEMFADDPH